MESILVVSMAGTITFLAGESIVVVSMAGTITFLAGVDFLDEAFFAGAEAFLAGALFLALPPFLARGLSSSLSSPSDAANTKAQQHTQACAQASVHHQTQPPLPHALRDRV